MSDPKSTHLPEVAGAIETVTGSLTLETGLRNVQSYSITLAQASSATEAIVAGILLDPMPGHQQKLTIKVYAVDGVTLGVNPVKVSWVAIGK